MPSLGGVRFVDCVVFCEPSAFMLPEAAAEPEALAPAEAWDSSVRVCSSAIFRAAGLGMEEKYKKSCAQKEIRSDGGKG